MMKGLLQSNLSKSLPIRGCVRALKSPKTVITSPALATRGSPEKKDAPRSEIYKGIRATNIPEPRSSQNLDRERT